MPKRLTAKERVLRNAQNNIGKINKKIGDIQNDAKLRIAALEREKEAQQDIYLRLEAEPTTE